jgi:hypothetical protein
VLFDSDIKKRDSSIATRRKSPFVAADQLRVTLTLVAVAPPKHAVILRDFFWTLYSKLAAVLEGHRLIYEVARWISAVRLIEHIDHHLELIKGSETRFQGYHNWQG